MAETEKALSFPDESWEDDGYDDDDNDDYDDDDDDGDDDYTDCLVITDDDTPKGGIQ